MEEIFDRVDEHGKIIGTVRRSEVHGNPELIHQSVHCLVFNSMGELYLQKRSMTKDIQPGKWDTSVGGHVDQGETPDQAVKRECFEELSVQSNDFVFLYRYIMKSDVETEFVSTYELTYDGDINFNELEISDGRFYTPQEIDELILKNPDYFTFNFIDEWNRYKRRTK